MKSRPKMSGQNQPQLVATSPLPAGEWGPTNVGIPGGVAQTRPHVHPLRRPEIEMWGGGKSHSPFHAPKSGPQEVPGQGAHQQPVNFLRAPVFKRLMEKLVRPGGMKVQYDEATRKYVGVVRKLAEADA